MRSTMNFLVLLGAVAAAGCGHFGPWLTDGEPPIAPAVADEPQATDSREHVLTAGVETATANASGQQPPLADEVLFDGPAANPPSEFEFQLLQQLLDGYADTSEANN